MSDAPERIWLNECNYTQASDKHSFTGVKYVRADLATPTNAKQLQQALAMPEIKALVDALHKSADGWDNVIGMGLIAKKHFGSARVLQGEALDALQRVGEQP